MKHTALGPAPHPLDELVSALRAQWDALRTHELTPGGIRRHAELTGLVWGLARHLGVPAPTTSQPGETR